MDLGYIFSAIAAPFFYVLMSNQRIFLLYLLTALLLAFVVYRFHARRRPDSERRGFWSYLLPKSIYWHASARVDYRYFIVNRIAHGLILAPVIALGIVGAKSVAALATLTFGEIGEPLLPVTPLTTVAVTLAGLLAMDFGLFITHYLQHKVPSLWEFHKVHHSAEVLTPITVYRMHPVDDLFSATVAGSLIGIVHGVFGYLTAGGAEEYRLFGMNMLLVVFYVAGYNLRHSHVWLPLKGLLGRLFISPAHHQIHHSDAERHYDRNFGFIFAFWDWAAGSLYVPEKYEKLSFGLADGEHREFDSVRQLYALPFVKLLRRLAPPLRSSRT